MTIRGARLERISLCLIVRDEAATLGRCLASAAPYVDEMVVVDTGSTDDTVAIAASHGATIGRFTWCDDFAAARNAALDLATGAWVLSLDADETIDPRTAPNLRRLAAVAGDGLRCYGLLIRNHRADGGGAGACNTPTPVPAAGVGVCTTPLRSQRSAAGAAEDASGSAGGADDGGEVRHFGGRFFRRHPRVRWLGCVHEVVGMVGDDRAAVQPALEYVLTDEVVIDHYGYAGGPEVRRRKGERNAALLRRAIEREPEDGYYPFKLGQYYLAEGDAGAAVEWLSRARELARRLRPPPRYLAGVYQSLLAAYLRDAPARVPGEARVQSVVSEGTPPHPRPGFPPEVGRPAGEATGPSSSGNTGHTRGARLASAEATADFPDHPWLWYLAGRLHEAAGQPASATAAYSRSAGLRARAEEYALDPRVMARPFARLGRLALASGNLSGAGKAFAAALEISPSDGEALLGLAEAHSATGDGAAAAAALERYLGSHPEHDSVCAWLGACRRAAGDVQSAYDYLWDVVSRHPDFAQSRLNLGQLLHDEGEPRAALEVLAPFVEIDAQGAAYELLADVLDVLGRGDDAVAARQLAAARQVVGG